MSDPDTLTINNAAAVEADTRTKLILFQAKYPLRSKNIAGDSWVFRRTLGKLGH